MLARLHLVGTSMKHFYCLRLRRDYHSKTMFQRTGHPYWGGLITIHLYPYPYKIWIHFTIFLCTQQLLKEKQGRPTWPFLDWLHPPGSFGAKAWCMLGGSIRAQERASNRNRCPRIWNKKKSKLSSHNILNEHFRLATEGMSHPTGIWYFTLVCLLGKKKWVPELSALLTIQGWRYWYKFSSKAGKKHL